MDSLLAEPKYFLIVLLLSSRSVSDKPSFKADHDNLRSISLSLNQYSPGLIDFFDLFKETIFGILRFLNCQFSVSLISTLMFVFSFFLGLLNGF